MEELIVGAIAGLLAASLIFNYNKAYATDPVPGYVGPKTYTAPTPTKKPVIPASKLRGWDNPALPADPKNKTPSKTRLKPSTKPAPKKTSNTAAGVAGKVKGQFDGSFNKVGGCISESKCPRTEYVEKSENINGDIQFIGKVPPGTNNEAYTIQFKGVPHSGDNDRSNYKIGFPFGADDPKGQGGRRNAFQKQVDQTYLKYEPGKKGVTGTLGVTDRLEVGKPFGGRIRYQNMVDSSGKKLGVHIQVYLDRLKGAGYKKVLDVKDVGQFDGSAPYIERQGKKPGEGISGVRLDACPEPCGLPGGDHSVVQGWQETALPDEKVSDVSSVFAQAYPVYVTVSNFK
jgi:hypothetical protein